jgi:signal transduction histidine kinase
LTAATSTAPAADTLSSAEADRPDLPSIRRKLILLVAVCLIPGCLAVGLLIHGSYHRQRALLEQNMVQTARALALAVDREIASTRAALQTLATSPHLASGDLTAFYRQARTVQDALGGDNIVLSDHEGRQILNLSRPFGTRLPNHGAPEQVRAVAAANRPAVSDLFLGGVIGRQLISIDVPAGPDGTAAYVISMAVLPEHLGRILAEQHLPRGWIAAVFDSRGVIIARTHQPDKFVGQRGSPVLVERIRHSREGLSENVTLEGIPVYGAFSHSNVAPWSVAIGVPKQTLLADLHTSILMVSGAVLLLTAAGLGLAWRIGGTIRGSVRSLVAPALALGSGADVRVPRQTILETDELAVALNTATRLLAARTAERDEARRSEAEIQRLLQNLIDADGELQRFAHIASHDLQEPLRIVTSFTQLLARRLEGRLDDECDEYVRFVVSAATRMRELITGLMVVANVSGQGQSMAPVPASQACMAALNNLRDSIAGSAARIEVDDLPVVVAAEIQLMQVFQNLIGNAIKFRRPDRPPRIRVTAEQRPGLWRFSVADNGIGIERSDQDIFEIFRRLHPGGAYPGAGIGLAVCKKIVQGHGGEIWVEPNPEGGSIFRFTLPAPSDGRS